MSLSITCVDTLNYEKSLHALKRTIETLKKKTSVTKIYWYSDKVIVDYIYGVPVTHIPIESMNGQNDYSHITLKVIPEVCDCDYDLIVQWDGYAVNPEAWTDDFFNYDYIGATWDDGLVGNGGFSWRSKKLYDAMSSVDIKSKYEQFDKSIIDTTTYHGQPSYAGEDKSGKFVPEDVIIARLYRQQLEDEFAIKYAPYEIADRFSVENHSYISPWTGKPHPWIGTSLGFHGKYGILSLYNL